MSSILIDNWSLQQASVSINNTYELNEIPNSTHINLIEAIILWDDIYFIENEFTSFWKEILWRFGYENYIKQLQSDKISKCNLIANSEYANNYITQYPSLIAEGAIKYNIISNLLSINYFPSSERAAFLIDNNFDAEFVNRNHILNYLDKSITDYYGELNNKLGTRIRFKWPILFDFVASNTKDSRFYINTALQIKDTKEVKQFRKSMDEFELMVNSYGEINEIKRHMSLITENIEELTKITKIQFAGDILISIIPSVSLQYKIGKNKNFHSNFFRTLTNYAINKRKPNKSNNNLSI